MIKQFYLSHSWDLNRYNHSGSESWFTKCFCFCLDMAQGHMNEAPNETQTHSCKFASLACWPLCHRSTLLQVKVDLGIIAMKGYFTFLKASELEPYHQMVQYHIQDNCWEESLTSLQRCNWHILQPNWLDWYSVDIWGSIK